MQNVTTTNKPAAKVAKLTIAEFKNAIITHFQYTAAGSPTGKAFNETVRSFFDFYNVCKEIETGAVFELTDNGKTYTIKAIYEINGAAGIISGSFQYCIEKELTGALRFFESMFENEAPAAPVEPVEIIETVILDTPDIEALQTAVNFVGKDEIRLSLTGVFIGRVESSQRPEICATDANVLYSAPIADNLQGGYILPVALCKQIKTAPAVLSFYKKDGLRQFCRVETTAGTFESELINEKYPDYPAVIPREIAQLIPIELDKYAAAHRFDGKSGFQTRIKSAANYAGFYPNLLMLINGLDAKLIAHCPNYNRHSIESINVHTGGENIEFYFNVKFMQKALKPFAKCKTLLFGYNAKNRAALLHSATARGSVVIMPMELKDREYLISNNLISA